MKGSSFAVETTQRDAWAEQIALLRDVLAPYSGEGHLFFEFAVPRVGRRIDVLVALRNVLFVLEFKAFATEFSAAGLDQVWDYALDLKNFHSSSHDKTIAPILVATGTLDVAPLISVTKDNDELLHPIRASANRLPDIFAAVLDFCDGDEIDPAELSQGHYSPTPTIIEAAMALYGGHSVKEISRSDASAVNLAETSVEVTRIIERCREEGRKAICFVTGVPGAGKTLVGLNVATQHTKQSDKLHSVFLSGNGSLVAILGEALALDKRDRLAAKGEKATLSTLRSEVKTFIQNVHHFRDELLIDPDRAPIEHVAIFDEAQRAWNHAQTASFMGRKKGRPNFPVSEPEYLISGLDRHPDWAVVVCLVGGGQEINTGEAGIGEWVEAIMRSFPEWHIYLSPNLRDSEFGAGKALELIKDRLGVHLDEKLHLSVSMRSFRAENVSALVKQLLDLNLEEARQLYAEVSPRYPIVITRDLARAKAWLREKARGSERYGMVVSSQAERLRPHAIDVRVNVNPVHWFLKSGMDVRSSLFLEDAASEFDVQGLELDWTCVVWDADMRFAPGGWKHWMFKGDKWQRISKPERQMYQKNAYRVLLTRARQGMVIVVPPGDETDHTRSPEFYDGTYEYLRALGVAMI